MRLNIFTGRHDRPHHKHDDRRYAQDDAGHGAHRDHGKHGRHGERAGERHGKHGGGPGGLGRFFEHGDLKLVILALIAEKPRHGYEIIKDIEERVAGAYSPSPGVVYPTLTFLEETGHVTVAASTGAKKLHTITTEGTQFLDAQRVAVDALMRRITDAGKARASVDAPPVRRGMENLKLALRLRMDRGPLTEDQVRSISRALDAAAVAIEQS